MKEQKRTAVRRPRHDAAPARVAHARERRSGGSGSCTSRASTRSGAAVWPGPSSRPPSSCSRTATSPASPTRRCSRPTIASGCFRTSSRAAVHWSVSIVIAGRDRSHQHSPRVAAGDAPGGDGARAAAGLRARRRLPDSRPGDAAAADHRRRSAIDGHRGRVDPGQGHARSADVRAARARIRATASIATRATRRAIISTPSAGSATRRCIAARSGRRRCLIRSRPDFGHRLEHPHSLCHSPARRCVPDRSRAAADGRAMDVAVAAQRLSQRAALARSGDGQPVRSRGGDRHRAHHAWSRGLRDLASVFLARVAGPASDDPSQPR